MIVGLVSCCCCLAYFSAPLLLMKDIVLKRDASPIYLPMVAANTVSAIMWFVYGLFGVDDMLIWVPNCISLVLTTTQFGKWTIAGIHIVEMVLVNLNFGILTVPLNVKG